MEKLLYVALVFLASEASGLDRGNNQSSNASALDARIYGEKTASFRLHEEVNLTCGDKPRTETKTLYIIWHLDLKYKSCEIRESRESHKEDKVNDCRDQKSLRNSSGGQPVLHIPDFSYNDVGNYTCSWVYSGGAVNYVYHLNITAPPNVSSWIEPRGDRTVAVCRAEKASPGATITWSSRRNETLKVEEEEDGLVSVQSSVEVGAGEDPQNLSCTITHPYWDQPRVIVPELHTGQNISQSHSVVYVPVVITVVFCLALLLWGIVKLHKFRRGQNSSKSPASEFVEEVEPYESYVQRENSIYNSSRDLFT